VCEGQPAEWTCTTPETAGIFNRFSDCSLTASVELSGSLTITGHPSLTVITAPQQQRHFLISLPNLVLKLKWLKLTGGHTAWSGGSIRISEEASSTFLQASFCWFHACTGVDNGGAIAAFGPMSVVELLQTNITDSGGSQQTVVKYGGAIHVSNALRVSINGGHFSHNIAVSGGAMNLESVATIQVQNADLTLNSGTVGGAISLSGLSTTTEITKTRFENNTASYGGGGIYIDTLAASPVILTRVIFYENAVKGLANLVGGGALYCLSKSSVVLRESSLIRNRADLGGEQVAVDPPAMVTYVNMFTIESWSHARNVQGIVRCTEFDRITDHTGKRPDCPRFLIANGDNYQWGTLDFCLFKCRTEPTGKCNMVSRYGDDGLKSPTENGNCRFYACPLPMNFNWVTQTEVGAGASTSNTYTLVPTHMLWTEHTIRDLGGLIHTCDSISVCQDAPFFGACIPDNRSVALAAAKALQCVCQPGHVFGVRREWDGITTYGSFKCMHDIVLPEEVILSCDLSIEGKSGLTTVAAPMHQRHFTVGNTLTLKLINLKLSGGSQDRGGAIFVQKGGTLYATACWFFANEAKYGGGSIYAEGGTPVDSYIELVDSSITKSAVTQGGGGGVYTECKSVFNSITVEQNSATTQGPHFFCTEDSTCTFNSVAVVHPSPVLKRHLVFCGCQAGTEDPEHEMLAPSSASLRCTCVTCAAGKWSLQHDPKCANCPAGKLLIDDGNVVSAHDAVDDCKDCAAGSYSISGASVCVLCGIGTFKKERGAVYCDDCPYLQYQNEVGQISCKMGKTCPLGFGLERWDKVQGIECSLCRQGSYNADNQTVGSECKECPDGQRHGKHVQPPFTSCPPGKPEFDRTNIEFEFVYDENARQTTHVTVHWYAPDDDGGAEIIGYEYRHEDLNEANPCRDNKGTYLFIEKTERFKQEMFLVPETKHAFYVRAVNRLGVQKRRGLDSDKLAIVVPGLSNTILVDAVLGNNTSCRPCQAGDSCIPCASLNRAFELANVTGQTIMIYPSETYFESHLVPRVSGLRVVGNALLNRTRPVIDCQGEPCFLTNISDAESDGDSVSLFPTLIKGLVIQNGRAEKGGCAFAHKIFSQVQIEDSLFLNCSATQMGGGLFITESVSVQLQNVSFENNTAADAGGGIYMTATHNLMMSASTFVSNHAGSGGAIAVVASDATSTVKPKLSVTQSTFKYNRANSIGSGDGGGAISINSGIFTSHGNLFLKNYAERNGGGLRSVRSDVSLVESVFDNNRGDNGGGIGCLSSQMEMVNVTARNNEAGTDGGGGWFLLCSPVITSSTWVHNKAHQAGGGVYFGLYSLPTFPQQVLSEQPNSIISFNEATVRGGGLDCFKCSGISMAGVVFEGNVATNGPGGGIALTDINAAPDQALLLDSINFTACQSGRLGGGGLYMSRCSNTLQIKRSLFLANIASNGGGGGLLWEVENTEKTHDSAPMVMAGCIYAHNKAAYGAFLASTQYKLFMIDGPTKDGPERLVLPGRSSQGQDISTYSSMANDWKLVESGKSFSGNGRYVNIAVFDWYHQIVRSTNLQITLSVIGNNNASVSGATKIACLEGVAIFKEAIARGIPQSNISMDYTAQEMIEPVDWVTTFKPKILTTFKDCNAGYVFLDDLQECIPCEIGRYGSKTRDGRGTCDDCSAGKYQLHLGQSRCIACSVGQFQDEPKKTECKVCRLGQYSSTLGEILCKNCPIGMRGLDNGTCSNCTFGMYAAEEGSTICRDCDTGKFIDRPGSSACVSCDPGMTTAGEKGQEACFACEVGQFAQSATELSAGCAKCDSGQYSNVRGARSCTSCKEGRTTNGEKGASTCSGLCPAGTFGILLGTTSGCRDCPFGKWTQDRAGSTTCLSCLPGQEYDGQTRRCVQCPAGRYSFLGGFISTRCQPCPRGAECKGGMSLHIRQGFWVSEGYSHDDYGACKSTSIESCTQKHDGLDMIDKPSNKDGAGDCQAGEFYDRCGEKRKISVCGTQPDINPGCDMCHHSKCLLCQNAEKHSECAKFPERQSCQRWTSDCTSPDCKECRSPACIACQSAFRSNSTENNGTSKNRSSLAHGVLWYSCDEENGYSGKLCQRCLPGFAKDSSAELVCVKCNNTALSFALIAVGLIIGAGGLMLFIGSNMNDAGSSDVAGATQKIIVNYLQTVSIAASFPLKWPSELRSMFAAQSSASSFSDNLMNFDCEMAKYQDEMSIFWQKQLFYVVFPLLLLSCNVAFWCIHPHVKCKKKESAAALEKRSSSLKRMRRERMKRMSQKALHHSRTLRAKNEGLDLLTAQVHKSASHSAAARLRADISTYKHAMNSRGDGSAVLLARKLMEFIHEQGIETKELINTNADDHVGVGDDALVNHFVTEAHFTKMMEDLNVPFTHEELVKIAELLDGDGDGKITVHGLVSFYRTTMDKIILSSSIIMFILYPTLCSQVFKLFACKSNLLPSDSMGAPSQVSFIQSDLQIQCYGREHTLFLLCVGVPALIVYIFGFPMLSIVFLKKNSGKKISDQSMYRYSMFLNGYRPERFFWECIIALRKAVVTFVSVFFVQMGVFLQTYMAILILFVFLTAHVAARPYATEVLNRMESLALVTSFLTLYLGIILFLGVQNDAIENTIPFFLLAINIAFAIWAVREGGRKLWRIIVYDITGKDGTIDKGSEDSKSCFDRWRKKTVRAAPAKAKLTAVTPIETKVPEKISQASNDEVEGAGLAFWDNSTGADISEVKHKESMVNDSPEKKTQGRKTISKQPTYHL
jgi:predicted outer membrane repeat protein